MAIDANEVLEEVKYYLPTANVFTDAQMLTAINKEIAIIGSDDSYYEEVTCKSTKRIAEDNAAKSSAVSELKKIKTKSLEEEFFQGNNTNIWDNFLDRIDTVCANIGYTGLSQYSSGFMYINPGSSGSMTTNPPINVNNTTSGCNTTSANIGLPL